MGKGDRRSKRGKIFRGTYGKKRPKPQEERKKAKAAAAAAAATPQSQSCRLAYGPATGKSLRDGLTFAVA
jgi:30S ribosomal protein S31